jgi:hypothetical protein
MGLPVHAIDMIDGSTLLANEDRLKVGMLTGVAVPGSGQMTAGIVDEPGSGYTSIPTGTAAGGTGGTITPSMAIATVAPAPAAPGITYAPGDTITLTGGTASQQGILEVQTTKAVAAPAVDAGGSDYAVGDQITLQNGLVVQVATLSGSAVATVTIVNGGSFTANNVTAGGLTQQSTTGSGSGVTFTMTAAKYGVNTFDVQNAGSYSALPSSPVSQGSTSGSGSGFELTVNTWQLQSFTAVGGNGYAQGAPVTFSGGGGSGAAGHVSVESLGDNISIPIAFSGALPSAYNVQVTANGPCIATVTEKTQTGFNIELAPASSGAAVGASTIDVMVFA